MLGSGDPGCALTLPPPESNLAAMTSPLERPIAPRTPLAALGWALVAVAGAGALGVIALRRGEPVSAIWLLVAAICTYAIGFRFYSAFIAARIFALDDRRA